ncbi:MAG: hypothetical protein IKN12_01475 [Selenomonadaceae bacterium]|nr:hypothetical protein [Selenomonadaceae bacterium]
MYILQNMTKDELNAYSAMPTAKALNERIKKDGVYIEKGNAKAAAEFTRTQGTLSKDAKDSVSISKEGMELQKSEKQPNIEFSLTKIGENRFRIGFSNSAMLHRAVKQGFLDVEGKRVELSDDVKNQLLASDKEITSRRKIIAMKNTMAEMAAQNRQTSDAMAKANAKMSRTMKTASRIMHGRKVSPADEKELMEFNHELYEMAKMAATLEKARRSEKDDKEDAEISRANDVERDYENTPKDYSVDLIEMPKQETNMDVSFEGDLGVAGNVGISNIE